MLTRADKESLARRNAEASGLASEIMAEAGSSRQVEQQESRDLGVAAVDDMIQGWEKDEVDDPSTDRWPAARQAELNPNHAADEAFEKAFDEKIEKWVEIPFNCICAVVALPLAGALAVAASPLLGALVGGEWLYRKLRGSKPDDNSGCDEPWDGLPDDEASGWTPSSLQDEVADHLDGRNDRESRLEHAKALVERADRVLADSKRQKALSG